MTALIRLFFDICRFKAGPADIPASRLLAIVSVGTYAAAGLAMGSLDQTMRQAVLLAVIDTGMLLALAYGGLWVRDLPERSVQTVTALAATGTLFTLLGLPLLVLLLQTPAGGNAILTILQLVLIMWNITVIGHILRHALSTPLWVGMTVSLLYVYTSLRVISALMVAGK